MGKKKLFNIIAAGFFLVAIVLWFALPAVKLTEGESLFTIFSDTYTFLEMTFGKTLKGYGLEVVLFKFSFLNLLTIMFLFGAIGVSVLRYLDKRIMKNDAFIVLALAILAVLFVVFSRQFTVLTSKELHEAFIEEFSLTGGAIAIAVLAGLGGLIAVVGE